MHELVSNYWWITVFTVPALAFAFRAYAERAAWVHAMSTPLQRKLAATARSYPGHWVVTATLRDGRRFSRVVIDERFQLVSDAALPFALRDIEDIAWEGIAEPPHGPILQLSAGRDGARIGEPTGDETASRRDAV